MLHKYSSSAYNACCCCCCLVTKSSLTPCDPVDWSPPSSSVHGLSQARIPEWVAISFFKGSSPPWDETHSSAWQADSLPPSHLGSPTCDVFKRL